MKHGSYKDRYGTRRWYHKDQLHRIGGPAVEFTNGDSVWFQYDRRHRVDGPASESHNGKHQWYLDGIYITEEVNAWMKETNITWPFDESTQVSFKLRFAT